MADSDYPHSEDEYEAIIEKAFRFGYQDENLSDTLVGDLYDWSGNAFGVNGYGDDKKVKLETTEEKVGFLNYVISEYELSDDEIQRASVNTMEEDFHQLYNEPMSGMIQTLLGGVLVEIAKRRRE